MTAALAGKRHVPTQQRLLASGAVSAISFTLSLRYEAHAVHKLNVINQIIQQRGIRFAVTDHTLLV